jgi:hypothetical protein
MMRVPHTSGEIKAADQSFTRKWAAELAANKAIDGRDLFRLVAIATDPEDLTAAHAWEVRRIAERAARMAS